MIQLTTKISDQAIIAVTEPNGQQFGIRFGDLKNLMVKPVKKSELKINLEDKTEKK